MKTLGLAALALSLICLPGCGNDTSVGDGSSADTGTGESGDTTGDGDGDGDTTGDGDGDGFTACPVLLACVEDCGGDMACEATCEAEATPLAQTEADELVACIVANACMDDACVEANCPAELFACNTGELTCGELVECAQPCAGNEACEASCYSNATTLAQTQIEQLNACTIDNGCDDPMCIQEFCGAELASCVGGMSDSYPCPIIAECLIGCAGDAGCELQCQRTTPEAMAEAEAYAACADTNECAELDCAEQACPDEALACSSGELSCADALACAVACEGASMCQLACYLEATPAAQALLDDLGACGEDSGCADNDANCIVASCPDEVAACEM